MIWPAADFVAPRHNDTSLVMSVRAAGRRDLLNGDIQQQAISDLLAAGSELLRADVTDLPHHGSFVEASPRWLRSLAPMMVLQSSGPARLLHDKWAGQVPANITRLVTWQQGMAEVDVDPAGRITWSSFKGTSAGK